MPRLCETDGLTDVQEEILTTVRRFVADKIIPVATELEHRDEYPADIVKEMKDLGIFGLTIPEEYGGLGESLLTYALTVEEISRGWMSVSGIINTHFIVAYLLLQHGTEEQKRKYLPRMATGEIRGAFSMSEPGLGSDVAAIKTKAERRSDGSYAISGQKMWLTNGGSANLVAVLVRTEEGRQKPHQNLTTFLVEKEPGFGEITPGITIPGKIDKMGYKGVDTTEMIFDNYRIDADLILGNQPGRGFYQMMDGVEIGRVNVAARAVGVATRAFELGIGYAQQRETFGRKIAEHQAVLFRLAEMGTKIEAAHQMMVRAARLKDSGARNDLEAGMAKFLASEYCKEVVEDSFRIHGGYGFAKEYEIERLYREAPMLLIGEGTADIQRIIIGRRLLEDYRQRLPKRYIILYILNRETTVADGTINLRERGAKRQRLPEEVAGYARELIISGEVRPGDFLRMERIAEAMGVSHTPVREGLLTLKSEGFVRLIPRRGFVVASFTPQDVRDLFWVQAQLAGELVGRAAETIRREQVARLEAIDAEHARAIEVGDAEPVTYLGHAFHREINLAAGSHRLSLMLGAAVKHLPNRFYSMIEGQGASTRAEHPALIQALRERQARKARSIMEGHIFNRADHLIKLLEERGLWDNRASAF